MYPWVWRPCMLVIVCLLVCVSLPKVIETNLTGTFMCCREAHTAWMGAHGGAIVNIIADINCGFPGMA